MSVRPPNSPSSSPRLPSPPPIAEDQTKPISPRPGAAHQTSSQLSRPSDTSGSRRIRPGTKAADIAEGPPLVEISDIDSPFQLTEHLKALYQSYTHPPGAAAIIPLTIHQSALLATPPSGIDKHIWLYELCRFLVQKINLVINALFADSPPCSAATCPEMRASEWQYLCAVHQPPKACCAIDYCCHTLDWAANSLTSPKEFPSRLSLGSETAGSAQVKTITNIMRRVYRIFAHSWFSHRDMFWQVENRTGLYVLFKTVCDAYALIPEDNYTIPPEAEGREEQQPPEAGRPTSVLKRTEAKQPFEAEDPSASSSNLAAPGATARRHRHTPSKGVPVDTVPEVDEEEDPTIPDNPDTGSPPQFDLDRGDTQLRINPDSPPLTSVSPKRTSTMLPSPKTPAPLPPSSRPQAQDYLSTSPPASTSPPPPDTEAATLPQATIEEFEPLPDDVTTTTTDTTAFPAVPDSTSPLPPHSPPPITTTSTEKEKKTFSPFSSFSPASPKATTFEEMQEQGYKTQTEEREQDKAKDAVTETEGKQAGQTKPAESDEASKSVED